MNRRQKFSAFTLISLSLFLGVIFIANIHPTQALLGWDNFSTYLNPSTNFSRTLFSTWRAYRGLGVPGDSESTDTLRQVFHAALNVLLPRNLVDQVYVLLLLAIGISGVIALTYYYTASKSNSKIGALSGLSAGLTYLFSLNTVGSFFFPMPMYTARYAFFPWVIYLFLRCLDSFKRHRLLAFALVTLIASTAYLTATVFFTLWMVLLLISFSSPKNIKKALVLNILFLLLNSYWLLPFTHYSLTKSTLITQGSTFNEVNENQLNQNNDNFTWSKLLTQFPSFFTINAAKDINDNPISLHPDAPFFSNSPITAWPLFLPHLLVLIGLSLIFGKEKHKPIWPVLLVLISLIMLRKELPPLGFVYDWLGNTVPYFKIVFRFGDTKFNALLSLSISVLAGIGIFQLSRITSRLIKSNNTASLVIALLVVAFVLPQAWLLRSVINGNLVSPLMQTTVPPAYFEIADLINADPDPIRVMHLPQDSLSYWKAHSWGYFGSTFMAFLLDKPLFERTFIPASKENDLVDSALRRLAQEVYWLADETQKTERIKAFAQLLAKTGTRYLILDHTITTENQEDAIGVWGNFESELYSNLITKTAEAGYIANLKTYHVDVDSPFNTIEVFKTTDLLPPSIKSNITIVEDQHHDNSIALQKNTIQGIEKGGLHEPFRQVSNPVTLHDNEFSLPLARITEPNTRITLPQSTDTLLTIAAALTDEALLIKVTPISGPNEADMPESYTTISFPRELIPELERIPLATIASDWHTLPFSDISQLRLKLGELIVPIPYPLGAEFSQEFTVLVENGPIDLALLAPEQSTSLDLSSLDYTENPNCFQDAVAGYTHNLTATSDKAWLETENGSTCATLFLPGDETQLHYEVSMHANLVGTTESTPSFDSPSNYQKDILKTIAKLPTANYFSACLIHPDSNHCLNNHHSFGAQGKSLTIASNRATSEPPQLLISLPSIGMQKATLELSNFVVNSYATLETISLDLTNQAQTITLPEPITSLTFPPILSTESYYFNPYTDALRVFNQPCSESNSFRTSKRLSFGTTLLYEHGCSHGLYTQLPFSSDHAYVWNVSYHLYSGKYPQLSLGENFPYVNQYTSLNQGYPSVPGFRSLQTADPFAYGLRPQPKLITDRLSRANFTDTSVIIPPHPGMQENASRQYTLTQNSPNQGIVGVDSFNVTRIPTSWWDMSLSTSPTTLDLNPIDQKQTPTLLPSLWQINAQATTAVINNQQSLIVLDQAYDPAWKLYTTSNPLFAFFGLKKTNATHVKVNNLTNGWVIDTSSVAQPTTFHVLYWPERLTFLGMGITLATLGSVTVWSKKKQALHPPTTATTSD